MYWSWNLYVKGKKGIVVGITPDMIGSGFKKHRPINFIDNEGGRRQLKMIQHKKKLKFVVLWMIKENPERYATAKDWRVRIDGNESSKKINFL